MATQVVLKRDGIAKNSYVGFSWTVFFFGFWVPLIRGRSMDALGMFVIYAVVGYFSYGAGALVLNVILGFLYNKYATEQMLNKEGYEPADEMAENILKRYDIFVKH